MYKINVFTAKRSLSWVQQLEKIKPSFCEFHYYAYTDFEHLNELLEKYLEGEMGRFLAGKFPISMRKSIFKKQRYPCIILIFQSGIFIVPLQSFFMRKRLL